MLADANMSIAASGAAFIVILTVLAAVLSK